MTRPNSGPPRASCANCSNAGPTAASPCGFSPPAAVVCTRSRKMRNNTYAVPSLRRLSPSMMVPRRLDAPTDLSSDTTATGSVAERMEPAIRHVSRDQSYGSTT